MARKRKSTKPLIALALASLCACTALGLFANPDSLMQASPDKLAAIADNAAGAFGAKAENTAVSLDQDSPGMLDEHMAALIENLGEDTGAGKGGTARAADGAEYRRGEVLARFTSGVSEDKLDELLELAGCSSAEALRATGSQEWMRLRLMPGVAVAKALSELAESGLVAEAQPNFVYRPLEGEVSDSQSAALASSALAAAVMGSSSEAWHLEAVHAVDAWNTHKTNREVTVAVIDSGCDVRHLDLADNIVGGYNVVDGSANIKDDVGHGTHVAGIISAISHNQIGCKGVSGDASLYPVKIIDGYEADTVDWIAAYEHIMSVAKRHNIRVINASLGSVQWGADAWDRATLAVIDKAHAQGILSVFASGNVDSESPKAPFYTFPCDFSECSIGVINVNSEYESSVPDSDSNYNVNNKKTKDLAAPGKDIRSTLPGNRYKEKSGTSMASPVVAGIAALAASANPDLNAGELKSLLCSTAQDLGTAGFDALSGYGLVRADLAVKGAHSSYIEGPDALAAGSTAQYALPQAALDSGDNWRWSIDRSSSRVATVDQNGVVSGLKSGEAILWAKSGGRSLARTIFVCDAGIEGPNSVACGSSIVLTPDSGLVSGWNFSSSNPRVATVDEFGTVTGKRAGQSVTITARSSTCPDALATKTIKVVKGKNPLSVKGKTKTIRRAKLKKKACKLSGLMKMTKKGAGAISYTRAKGSSKWLKINKKTGVVTVKRNAPKRVHVLKILVKAKGNSNYKAATKKVTVRVKVR